MTTYPVPIEHAEEWEPEVGTPAYIKEHSIGARLAAAGGLCSIPTMSEEDRYAFELKMRQRIEEIAAGHAIKVPMPVPTYELNRQLRKQKHHWRGAKWCSAVKSPKVLRVHPLMDDEQFGKAITDADMNTCINCTNQYLDAR